jgi:hypothetical protein
MTLWAGWDHREQACEISAGQALGVFERSPVPRSLEVPGDARRAFLPVRVVLQGQVDRF